MNIFSPELVLALLALVLAGIAIGILLELRNRRK